MLQVRIEILPLLEVEAEVCPKSQIGNLEFLIQLLKARSSKLGNLCNELLIRVTKFGDDIVCTGLHELGHSELLCHFGDFQDVEVGQQLGHDGGHCLLQVLHEVEVRHKNELFSVFNAKVLRKADPVDEPENHRKDLGSALLDINVLWLLSDVSVQFCFEVC